MKYQNELRKIKEAVKPAGGIFIAVEGLDGVYRLNNKEEVTEEQLKELEDNNRNVVIRCRVDGFWGFWDAV